MLRRDIGAEIKIILKDLTKDRLRLESRSALIPDMWICDRMGQEKSIMSYQVSGNRKELKIANIVEEGRYGGPHARIVGVAEKLKEEHIETIVIFPKNNSVFFYEKLTERGIQIKRLILHHLTRQKSHLINYFIFFIPELLVLYRLIKKESIDIVHCNGSWQIKGVIAGKLSGSKVIWHLNDTHMPTFINIVFKFSALHFCDAFITAGEKVKSYYLRDNRFSKKQIMEIQAPVDTSLFNPQKVKADQQIACCDGLKIVTTGNINPAKGIEYFIEMASILNGLYDNLRFFVVGPQIESQSKYSGMLFDMIKKSKIKNIHFYGPSSDVPPVLKATDIYVCSSIAEASPVSVWEAMAMAKPIVATDVGDIRLFMKNGENGFVVPTKNVAALAEKVGILIESKTLREGFGQKARDVAVKYLDLDICTKKHARYYREIVGKL